MKKIALTGLIIWLAATVALRLWGQRILFPDNLVAIGILLFTSALLMFWLPRKILGHISPDRRPLAAIILVVPGMLLDTFSTVWFSLAFPNIRPDAAGLFGGWLLLCNVMVLIGAARFSTEHD